MIARVLLPIPTDHPFDFSVPGQLQTEIAVGKRVMVRFHGREAVGLVSELAEHSEHPGALEPVLSVKPGPSLTPRALSFCLDTAAYYMSPPGPFVNRILPRTLSVKRRRLLRTVGGLAQVAANIQSLSKRAPRQAEVLRFLLAAGGPVAETELKRSLKTSASVINRLLELGFVEEVSPEPQEMSGERSGPMKRGEHRLLFSRSRMDEYASAIESANARGEMALILEPEILIARAVFAALQGSLSIPISLYHSGISEGERGRIWSDVSRGSVHVVVGTRSALFLPFPHLGLVIVDEEQDRSYKQDEMLPHYHARDMVARMDGVEAIFGSAAPSIETFHRAREGKIELVRDRGEQAAMDTIVVDMKGERGALSQDLLDAIAETLAGGRRALIGVNARGYFQAVLCKKCGQPLRCPRCGANLTYDVRAAQLVCRVCGTAYPRMVCPNCGSRSLRFVGIGSERVEQIMRERFPNATIARIDRTSLASKGALARAEGAINGAAQIIVATPLAAKGPIIRGLGLAAAIGADAILARPDFRAAERAYQYLQGLFGRLDGDGRAIVQTSYPDHYAIRAAVSGDYDTLYDQEISQREEMFYPPFSHLARIIIPHTSDSHELLTLLEGHGLQVIGPAPHPRKRSRDVILIKGESSETVRAACARVNEKLSGKGKNTLEIDIDPDQL